MLDNFTLTAVLTPHIKCLPHASEPTIDFKDRGVNDVCEQWVVDKFELLPHQFLELRW